MCFRIFLQSFRRVWFSSDEFAQSYRLSKRVNNMNPGHVKGVHDVNEVALFRLMSFAFREVHFLSNYSPQKRNGLLVPMYSLFVHIHILPLIILCSNVSSLVFIQTVTNQCKRFLCNVWFRPSRIKSTLSSNLLYHFKQVHDYQKSSFCFSFIMFYTSVVGVFLNLGRI